MTNIERAKVSNNARLEHVFKETPSYVNREYTLPCDTEVVYEDAQLPQNVLQGVRDNIRVVISPQTYAWLRKRLNAQVEVRASPFECCRVLELGHPVTISGSDRIITYKGGGVAQSVFTLFTGNDYYAWVKLSPEDQSKLIKFPFYRTYGWLDQPTAENELKNSQNLQSKGIDTESVVGVYKVIKLPDEKGKLQPLDYYRKNGQLPADLVPVILARSHKENLRLYDPTRLQRLGLRASLSSLAQLAREQFGIYLGKTAPLDDEYFNWLIQHLITQQLQLFIEGYKLTTDSQIDCARNISIMGEKLDLDSVRKDDWVFNSSSVFDHQVRTRFGQLVFVLYKYANDLGILGNLDHGALVYKTVQAIDEVIEGTNFKAIHSKLKQTRETRFIYESGATYYVRIGIDQLREELHGGLLHQLQINALDLFNVRLRVV